MLGGRAVKNRSSHTLIHREHGVPETLRPRLEELASVANNNARLPIQKQRKMITCLVKLTLVLSKGLASASTGGIQSSEPLNNNFYTIVNLAL